MKKPVYYRKSTWEFVKANHSGQIRLSDLRKLGNLALEAGILDRPDLLQETVIELEDEVEYVIDREAAEQLSAGAQAVTLVRHDGKERPATRKEVLIALLTGPTFDQLSLQSRLD